MLSGSHRKVCAIVVVVVTAISAVAELPPSIPFPVPLSPEMPFDVNMVEKKKLETNNQFPQVQRLFDVLSWQTFIAVNWPVTTGETPAKGINDPGRRLWETWLEALQVYKQDGSGPTNPNPPYDWGKKLPPPVAGLQAVEGARVLQMTHKKNIPTKQARNNANADVEDELLQAFSGPLVDQNGNFVHYEVLMNEIEYDYVVTNQFYNIDGQLAFSQLRKPVNFPSGMNKDGLNRPPLPKPARGAMELKLAWKQLDDKADIPERFIQAKAYINKGTDDKPVWELQKMGLVGMHIAIKTESSPTWIWATFEQIDNVRINDLMTGTPKYPSKPSFNDPGSPNKPVNIMPKPTGKDAGGNPVWDQTKVKDPVQVTRVTAIPLAKETLNASVQALLKKEQSPLQYYELIDTQWPTGTDPKTGTIPLAPAMPPGNALPYNGLNSVSNKAPGNITPVYLVNSTMETYFQKGNQKATQSEEGSSFDKTPIFATESCTGCHYSAGIALATNGKSAIFGAAGNGDFSWLMAMKAQWKASASPTPKPTR
jgi:hypothetical protein